MEYTENYTYLTTLSLHKIMPFKCTETQLTRGKLRKLENLRAFLISDLIILLNDRKECKG